MNIRFVFDGGGTLPSGNYNSDLRIDGTPGEEIPDLIDFDTGLGTGYSLWLVQAGATVTTAGSATSTYFDLPADYWNQIARTTNGGTAILEFRGLTPGDSYSVALTGFNLNGRDSDLTVEGVTQTYVTAGTADAPEAPLVFNGTVPADGIITFSTTLAATGGQFYGYLNGGILTISAPAIPSFRKSSTFDIETTLGTITTATLNSVNVFDHVTGQVGTTVSFEGAATDEITTSGEYTLTLGDGTGTEDITVQVNVVGLASFNINKDGADQGSLTDVEFIILTGAAGSRAINQQIAGITTTAGGDTGTIEITDAALDVDDTITVVQQSPTVGGDLVHTATLELI